MHDDLGDAISEGRVDVLGLSYQDPTECYGYISPEELEEIKERERGPYDPNAEVLDYIPW